MFDSVPDFLFAFTIVALSGWHPLQHAYRFRYKKEDVWLEPDGLPDYFRTLCHVWFVFFGIYSLAYLWVSWGDNGTNWVPLIIDALEGAVNFAIFGAAMMPAHFFLVWWITHHDWKIQKDTWKLMHMLELPLSRRAKLHLGLPIDYTEFPF